MSRLEVLYTDIEDTKQNVLERKEAGKLSYYEGRISFDVTKTKLANGANRNYNPKEIKSYVYSSQTQQFVSRGWCIINYGHRTRSSDFYHLGQEYHPITKDIHEPLGRVTKLSMNGKILRIEFVLTETKHNNLESVIKFIKLGIGGFSTVFNKKEGLFLGMDYVLSRNFVDNQIGIVMDNLCLSGNCDINREAREITSELLEDNRELEDEATTLLLKDARFTRLSNMVKKISKFKELEELTETLKRDIEVREDKLQETLKENDNLLTELKEIAKDNQKVRIKYNNATQHIKDLEEKNDYLVKEIKELQKEANEIKHSLSKEGLTYTDAGIALNVENLSNLFKQAYKRETEEVKADIETPISKTYYYAGKKK